MIQKATNYKTSVFLEILANADYIRIDSLSQLENSIVSGRKTDVAGCCILVPLIRRDTNVTPAANFAQRLITVLVLSLWFCPVEG